MKKLLSVLLSAVLILGLGVTAFAAEGRTIPEVPVEGVDANTPCTFDFEKKYVDQNGTDIATDKMPLEQLTFDVTGNDVANAPQLTVVDTPALANPRSVKVTVTPAETVTLGKYFYTITEKAGTTAGVTYNQEPIKVQVMIFKDDSGKFIQTVSFTSGDPGSKVTRINNVFESNKKDDEYGPLTIDKVVKGSLGDVTQDFAIDVTLTSEKEVRSPITVAGSPVEANQWTADPATGTWSYTAHLLLNDGTEKISILDVPKDVTFVVHESDVHTTIVDGHDYSNEPAKGYTVAYTVGKIRTDNGRIEKATNNNVVVTNTKGGAIDTGIVLDSAPYLIILAAALGGSALVTKKHHMEE